MNGISDMKLIFENWRKFENNSKDAVDVFYEASAKHEPRGKLC